MSYRELPEERLDGASSGQALSATGMVPEEEAPTNINKGNGYDENF